jgi:hypothetical protein
MCLCLCGLPVEAFPLVAAIRSCTRKKQTGMMVEESLLSESKEEFSLVEELRQLLVLAEAIPITPLPLGVLTLGQSMHLWDLRQRLQMLVDVTE